MLEAIDLAEAFLAGNLTTPSAYLQEKYQCGALNGLLSAAGRTCSPDSTIVCNAMLSDRDKRFAQRLMCIFDNSTAVLGEPCSAVWKDTNGQPGETIAFAIGISHLVRLESDAPVTVFDHFVDAGYTVTRIQSASAFSQITAYACPVETRAPPAPFPSQAHASSVSRLGLTGGEIAAIVVCALSLVAAV